MDRDLQGRVALVTGATGGIGVALCRALASSGANVAVAYGSNAERAAALAQEISTGSARAQPFAADMADPGSPARLVAEVAAALGPVDLLLANHGVGRRIEMDDLTAEDFDRTIAINLRSSFLLAQAVLPGMRARGFGRLIFTSSTAAFRGGVLSAAYTASKAGLHGLVHYLAARVSGDGVTVNAIAPGFVETAMLPGDPAQLGAQLPVGRVGRPEEVADLALAVLRNGYLDNQVIGLDGGAHPR